MRTATTADVIAFISHGLSIPAKVIDESSSLFHDLGVDGDDAGDFLATFAKQFDVSLEQFVFSDYFGDETSGTPFSLLLSMLRDSDSSFKRLEVRKLVEAAQSGVLV